MSGKRQSFYLVRIENIPLVGRRLLIYTQLFGLLLHILNDGFDSGTILV